MLSTLGVPPALCPIASPSLGDSVSSSSVVPTPAGMVEGEGTSQIMLGPKAAGIVEEMMLDQQLTTAFQTGLRHSLDDPDHDPMSLGHLMSRW